MDIDVEHEGQKTKVTPPSQSGGVEEDMEGGANSGSSASGEGGASSKGGNTAEGGASEGSKVS